MNAVLVRNLGKPLICFFRFGSTRPTDTPKFSTMSSTRTALTTGDRTQTPAGTAKSFSTPFKAGNRNASEENPRYQGKIKDGLKRPLFACVPFGKRRKLEETVETVSKRDPSSYFVSYTLFTRNKKYGIVIPQGSRSRFELRLHGR